MNNTSQHYGGGINVTAPRASFINNLIAGNAARAGAAIYGTEGDVTISNCTIADNVATDAGGGITLTSTSTATVNNGVLWGNLPDAISLDDAGALSAAYSNIQNGVGEAWFGEGCIDSDPLFVDPDGPDDDPATWEDNDYHLGWNSASFSPCVDAGDNTAVALDALDLDRDGITSERIPYDLDGAERFVEDPYVENTGVADPPLYRHVVDMGAYEYQFCLGDLNDDAAVNLADLARLLDHYGDTGVGYSSGDMDADGDVDIRDLAELLGRFGDECS